MQDLPGNLDHREDSTAPLELQYAPAHEVSLAKGGLLHGIAGQDRIKVNSLHSQGVLDLAGRLVPEAQADDGVIEAFRVDGAKSFALAVQWHPEWKVMENQFSRELFAAFGKAGRERVARRIR